MDSLYRFSGNAKTDNCDMCLQFELLTKLWRLNYMNYIFMLLWKNALGSVSYFHIHPRWLVVVLIKLHYWFFYYAVLHLVLQSLVQLFKFTSCWEFVRSYWQIGCHKIYNRLLPRRYRIHWHSLPHHTSSVAYSTLNTSSYSLIQVNSQHLRVLDWQSRRLGLHPALTVPGQCGFNDLSKLTPTNSMMSIMGWNVNSLPQNKLCIKSERPRYQLLNTEAARARTHAPARRPGSNRCQCDRS